MGDWASNVASRAQSPVYFLRIDGVADYDFSTGPVRNPTRTKKPYLEVPIEDGLSLNIIDGRRNPRQVNAIVLDVNDEVTQLLMIDLSTFINKRVTLYAGYADMDEVDYLPRFQGRITTADLLSDLSGYQMTLLDQTFLLDGTIFEGAEEGKPMVIEGNLINVWYSLVTGDFANPSFPLDDVSDGTPLLPNRYELGWDLSLVTDPGNAIDGDSATAATLTSSHAVIRTYFLEVGESRFSGQVSVDVQGLTDQSTTVEESLDGGGTWRSLGSVSGGERETFFGTVLDGFPLKQYAVRVHNGDPLLEQDIDQAAVGRVYTIQMNNTAATGLAVDAAELDDAELILQRDRWAPNTNVRVLVVDAEDSREFLEREFHRCYQCFPITLSSGKMAVRFYRPPLVADQAIPVEDADIYSITRWGFDTASHLNAFSYSGSENPSTGETELLYEKEDTDDQTESQERIRYSHDSLIMRADLGGSVQAEELAGRLASLFTKIPAVYDLECTFRLRDIQAGDTVAVKSDLLPCVKTGSRGIAEPKLGYVLAISVNGPDGNLVLTILEIKLDLYGVYAGSAAVPYASASETERATYAYLANATTELLSNGDPAKRWL